MDFVELGHPVPVRWGAWTSNTYDLQRAGWDIVADQSMMDFSTRIMIRDNHSGMVGYARVDNSHFPDFGMGPRGGPFDSMTATEAMFRQEQQGRYRPLEFRLMHDSTRMHHYRDGPDMHWFQNAQNYEPVDCTPQVVPMSELLHQYQVFKIAPIVEDENQIFAEPETVADLLDKIKKIQLPEQEQIRARMKKREKREGGVIIKPSAQLQAQILSFK